MKLLSIKALVFVWVLQILISCSNKSESTTSMNDKVQVVQDLGKGTEPPSFTYEQRQGKHLYSKYCAVCHGTEGKGDGFNAFNLDPKPRDFTDARAMEALTDTRLLETIREGGRGVNKSLLMPSWGGTLSSIEQAYVASYIRLYSRPTNQRRIQP